MVLFVAQTKIATNLRTFHTFRQSNLIQHEDFTKEELENLQKRESQNKTQLILERTKRQELEVLLKKEEELRKTKEIQLADERRRNQNTNDLDQAKLRIRQLEMERDAVREVCY